MDYIIFQFSNLTFADYIGSMGTIIVALAYLATQLRMMNSEDISFPIVNLVGSLLIGYSLYHSFNFASALMEIFWIIISMVGVFQWYKASKNAI